jgi:hypothetical protein
MISFSNPKFLAVYSGAVTAALMVVLLSGFAPARKKAVFDEIEVKRINLVEPDGTLRLVLSDKAMFPGAIVKGKEYPHNRDTAGFIFYNDEGTENGGLIFGGSKDKNGKVSAGGSLTFDQYEQDQAIQLIQNEEDGKRFVALKINDLPEKNMDWGILSKITVMKDGPEKAAEFGKHKDMVEIKNRIFIGKADDSSANIVLRDTQARKRAALSVAADGTPSLAFFDENGKETSRIPPETK